MNNFTKSHWSFDNRAARLQRANNKPRERHWRNQFRGVHTPTTHENEVSTLMKEYDCTRSQAERVLKFLSKD